MTRKWKCLGAVVENEPICYQGINLWEHPRICLDETVKLAHPNYPHQFELMRVYRTEVDGKNVIYAMTEFSAGVYGFYVAV